MAFKQLKHFCMKRVWGISPNYNVGIHPLGERKDIPAFVENTVLKID